eukprot:scaffold11172_cov172-Amphora_coffeaeformis.AAC.12
MQAGLNQFRALRLMLGENNNEEHIVEQARESLRTKSAGPVIPALEEPKWIDRTGFPLGIDESTNQFFPLVPANAVLVSPTAEISFAIRKMTDDESHLNNPFFGVDGLPISTNAPQPESE